MIEINVTDLRARLPEFLDRASRGEEVRVTRRGKVIAAEGEFQAARRLTEAAEIISDHPAALQLRFLQTLVEVGAENSSTVVFPVPIDLLKPLMLKAEKDLGEGGQGA